MFSLTHRRLFQAFGTRMAILAIALQLVLSFGHVHPLPGQVLNVSTPSQPVQHGPVDQDRSADCAICATIAAFASMALPDDVAVILPVRTAEAISLPAVEGAVQATTFDAFRSRAPPIA